MNRRNHFILFAAVLAVIVLGVLVLHLPTFIPLLICSLMVSLYCIFIQGKPWKEVLGTTLKAGVKSPWPLLLAIGALIASWVTCGAVPFLVISGLKLISPGFFLPSVLIICSAMSALTGSSWLTCGTLGIAFLGMSVSLGIPVGMTVGAVLCGAFFGDKFSRLSDFAVSTTAIAHADFSKHVRLMLQTEILALAVSLVIFFFLGRSYSVSVLESDSLKTTIDILNSSYNLNYLTLIPLVVLLLALLFKLPGIAPVLFSTASALIVSLTVQSASLGQSLLALVNGVHLQSGDVIVDSICNRGGIVSMIRNALMVFFAFTMGTALKLSGVMESIADPIRRLVKGKLSLVFATFVLSAAMAFVTGSGTIGVIVSYNVLSAFYDNFGLDHALFSRTICDMITLQQPIVIWGSSGAFVAQCFGLSAAAYGPYYFMGFLLPVFGLLAVVLYSGGKKK